MYPCPDIFQNHHRSVCFSWKIHRCCCCSFFKPGLCDLGFAQFPCADQKRITHQSPRKFSRGPLPHFLRTNTNLVAKLGCVYLCLHPLQLDCPKRLCWAKKKSPRPIRSDHSGELGAQMNIAKMAYNNTALAICLVSHVQDFQESFEQMIVGSFATQYIGADDSPWIITHPV